MFFLFILRKSYQVEVNLAFTRDIKHEQNLFLSVTDKYFLFKIYIMNIKRILDRLKKKQYNKTTSELNYVLFIFIQ